jgi:SAM-dependent methyltransferase
MMDIQLEEWNKTYLTDDHIKYDFWLKKFNGIFELKKDFCALDLGCGNGGNAKFLYDSGLNVTACDYSKEAIKNVSINYPEIDTQVLDMRAELPFGNASFSIIVADLSLHYFDESKTKDILGEIHRVLMNDGHLFTRVNSIRDYNHGSGIGEQKERNFYFHNGQYKRFFDNEMIDHFFGSGWRIINKEEQSTFRFRDEKVLWELVLEKSEN